MRLCSPQGKVLLSILLVHVMNMLQYPLDRVFDDLDFFGVIDCLHGPPPMAPPVPRCGEVSLVLIGALHESQAADTLELLPCSHERTIEMRMHK